MIALATALSWAIVVYVSIGLLFALVFVFRGVNRIDPGAEQGTLGFRVLILPGSVALWPFLLWSLLLRRSGRSGPPTEHNAHRDFQPTTGSDPR